MRENCLLFYNNNILRRNVMFSLFWESKKSWELFFHAFSTSHPRIWKTNARSLGSVSLDRRRWWIGREELDFFPVTSQSERGKWLGPNKSRNGCLLNKYLGLVSSRQWSPLIKFLHVVVCLLLLFFFLHSFETLIYWSRLLLKKSFFSGLLISPSPLPLLFSIFGNDES